MTQQYPPPQPPPYGQQPPQWAPPPQQQYPAPQPPAKKRRWPWVLGAIVLLFVVIGVANGGNKATPAPASGGSAAAPAAPARDAASGSTVVYEVTGKGAASVTYSKEGFSQEQQNGASLPFRKELKFQDKPLGAGLTVVAQHSSGGGDITCRITVDGKVVGESTSSGQYAVVTCNGNG